jgi:hypothetical protein
LNVRVHTPRLLLPRATDELLERLVPVILIADRLLYAAYRLACIQRSRG